MGWVSGVFWAPLAVTPPAGVALRRPSRNCRPYPESGTLKPRSIRISCSNNKRLSFSESWSEHDLNVLQTCLHEALVQEDYGAAARLRDRIKVLSGGVEQIGESWQRLGLPGWLADRADQLGFTVPTPIQSHAIPAIVAGEDVLIASQTGSGKTLAFLLPALAVLDVPPDLYPDDLKVLRT